MGHAIRRVNYNVLQIILEGTFFGKRMRGIKRTSLGLTNWKFGTIVHNHSSSYQLNQPSKWRKKWTRQWTPPRPFPSYEKNIIFNNHCLKQYEFIFLKYICKMELIFAKVPKQNYCKLCVFFYLPSIMLSLILICHLYLDNY